VAWSKSQAELERTTEVMGGAGNDLNGLSRYYKGEEYVSGRVRPKGNLP